MVGAAANDRWNLPLSFYNSRHPPDPTLGSKHASLGTSYQVYCKVALRLLTKSTLKTTDLHQGSMHEDATGQGSPNRRQLSSYAAINVAVNARSHSPLYASSLLICFHLATANQAMHHYFACHIPVVLRFHRPPPVKRTLLH